MNFPGTGGPRSAAPGRPPVPGRHTVTQQQDGMRRRWSCTCGWATEPTTYTNAADAAAAIRHELEHRTGTQE